LQQQPMDQALNSSRHGNTPHFHPGNYDRGGHHRHGGGGGYRRRRGRGHHHHGHRGQHHHSHHRGGGHHHHGGGGYRGDNNRGPRNSANRVSAQGGTKVDPTKAMLAQLSGMLAKIGDLSTSSGGGAGVSSAEEEVNVGQNSKNLAGVLCGDNAELFLNYEKNIIEGEANTTSAEAMTNADETMGEGATTENHNGDADAMMDNNAMETSTNSNKTPPNAAELAGPVATLIVNCAATLPLQTSAYVTLTADIELQAPDTHTGFAGRCIDFACVMLLRDLEAIVMQSGTAATPACFLRAKLVLRYLSLCASVGLLNWDQFTQFITEWTNVAQTAYTNGHVHAFVSLAYLLVSTLPYLAQSEQGFDAEGSVLSILRPGLQDEACTAFRPGVGLRALYLKSEQADAVDDDDGDDEDSDDDDEEDEDGVLPVCDTLGEVVKATETLLSDGVDGSKFALLNEFPWKNMGEPWEFATVYDVPASMMTTLTTSASIMGGDDNGSKNGSISNQIATMLSQPIDDNVALSLDSTKQRKSPCVIYASMPLFDEDTNAQTKALYTKLRPMDMIFIQQAFRDVLTAFMVTVTKNGVCVGNVKLAAEQVYSTLKLIRCDTAAADDGCSGSTGLEYLLIETLMSVMLQCTATNASDDSSQLYLYRIILELCKLQPDTLPQALAIGVGTLVAELTNLVPRARNALSTWFAFHLTNTEYQWPFWSHWDSFVSLANENDSRKVFLKGVMDGMVSYARGDIIKELALPEGSPLSALVNDVGVGFVSDLLDGGNISALSHLTRETLERIATKQPADALVQFLLEPNEEVTSEINENSKYWRSTAAIHALLASSSNDLVETLTGIERYHSLLQEVIKNDAESNNTDDSTTMSTDAVAHVEVSLLAQVVSMYSGNKSMCESVIEDLCRYSIVSPRSVLQLVFTDSSHFSKIAEDRTFLNLMINALHIAQLADSDTSMEADQSATMERVTDLVLYACTQIGAIVAKMETTSVIPAPNKLSAIVVSLVEGLKELYLHVITSSPSGVMISRCKSANMLRQQKSGAHAEVDDVIEQIAVCMERCLY